MIIRQESDKKNVGRRENKSYRNKNTEKIDLLGTLTNECEHVNTKDTSISDVIEGGHM